MPQNRPAELRTSCAPMATGRTWDAVRVPRNVGLTTLSILGPRSGAVIEDPTGLALYWFVAPGTAEGWDVTNTKALGRGSYVVVPPARRTQGPGPHWRICPGDGSWTTSAAALRAAIEDSLDPVTGRVRAS